MMFGLLARIFRVLWRQDSEGTGGKAVILDFPAVSNVELQALSITASAPVAFIRQAVEAKSTQAKLPPSPSRHLSAQLQSVSRLNGPSSRARIASVAARAHKPKPLATPPALKRATAVKPGVVIGRLTADQKRRSAAIVDLAEVRANMQLAKQIDVVDQEIVALFN